MEEDLVQLGLPKYKIQIVDYMYISIRSLPFMLLGEAKYVAKFSKFS